MWRLFSIAGTLENPPIAMVIIVDDYTHFEQYALAYSTLHCYAAIHKYSLHVLNTAANGTWGTLCPQTDFMFHRHCIVRHLLDVMHEEWVLFLDADMGVVNPNRLLEEFIPSNQSTHIVFYDRIMNHEIASGSYFVRNTDFSRRFLQYWADRFYSLPHSFHGTDNGAIHTVLLEFSLPNVHREKNFADLDDYTVCTRFLMARSPMDGIEIRNKSDPQRWVRDGWLTGSVWSPNDFMLHGWQTRYLDQATFAGWHSPLESPLGVGVAPSGTPITVGLAAFCRKAGKNASHLWSYKESFIGTDGDVKRILEKEIKNQEDLYAKKILSLQL